ncbi:MAG: ATP-binding domain-containing protein [Clostridiales bacterium]|nr:ATP-binding domain-containing protein [Clostridiales bacterium]MDY3746399.1 3'-5' exonuclease [Lachnospiraceae bacterium]
MANKQNTSSDFIMEENHLKDTISIVKNNISYYEKKEQDYQREVTNLFQSVRKGEGDAYGQLLAGMSILESTKNAVRKNKAALHKAYFGRIDYDDETYHMKESCYIGKNEVVRNMTEVIIVDWRSPVTSVYYENELGKGSYDVPGSTPIDICLNKKRTYDIDDDRLLGFYDDDTAASDDLLVKYLSQHKEAVLGEIIATIQKEQNVIIRDIPFKNIIVQGVAGSGKTTVALHRISYILYNYAHKYKPSEFCIVGSSDMLLNYISSGLPELDVRHVHQMRIDKFIPYLMGKTWLKKYKIVSERSGASVRNKLDFAKALETFLTEWMNQNLILDSVIDDEIGTILTSSNMEETRILNPQLSLYQLEKLLNERIGLKIKSMCSEWDPEKRKDKLKQYKKYFHSENKKWTALQIYTEFLTGQNLDCSEVKKGHLDIYDTAAMGLIHNRILMKKPDAQFSQIIIDEAQDFGEIIYYTLKKMLPDCYFTIMGDVSQNIHFETGLNDWNTLRESIFCSDGDSFCLLSKSYRNTIEISECAGKVLEKASQGSYKIQPVIRHGRPVQKMITESHQLLQTLQNIIADVKAKAFETIAVICRTEKEAAEVSCLLNIEGTDTQQFKNGVMVLPVSMTKGLEFDAVILWKPDDEHYGMNQKEAKLLYVAITRALHELYMIGDHAMSRLFD